MERVLGALALGGKVLRRLALLASDRMGSLP